MHQHPCTLTFDKEYRPDTSYIFLLRGTGVFLVLSYINPIEPYAPTFLHSSRNNIVFKSMRCEQHAITRQREQDKANIRPWQSLQ